MNCILMVEPRDNQDFKTVMNSVEKNTDNSWPLYFLGRIKGRKFKV